MGEVVGLYINFDDSSTQVVDAFDNVIKSFPRQPDGSDVLKANMYIDELARAYRGE